MNIPHRNKLLAWSLEPAGHGGLVRTEIVTNRTGRRWWRKRTVGDFLLWNDGIRETGSRKVAEQWIRELQA